MTLATRIGVMDHGKIVQIGTPRQIYEFPATRFVADFIGSVNLFDARGFLCFNSRDELGTILDALTAERYEQMLPYVRANKQKAITERWHNHAGLFARLAEALPEQALAGNALAHHSASRVMRVFRRWGAAI